MAPSPRFPALRSRPVALLCAGGLVLLATAGAWRFPGGERSTPEGTFEELRQAAGGKDWRGVWDLVDPEEQEKIETGLKDLRAMADQPSRKARFETAARMLEVEPSKLKPLTAPDSFAAVLSMMADLGGDRSAHALLQAGRSTLVGKRQSGDECTLEVETAGRRSSLKLVRRAGRWFLTGTGVGR